MPKKKEKLRVKSVRLPRVKVYVRKDVFVLTARDEQGEVTVLATTHSYEDIEKLMRQNFGDGNDVDFYEIFLNKMGSLHTEPYRVFKNTMAPQLQETFALPAEVEDDSHVE